MHLKVVQVEQTDNRYIFKITGCLFYELKEIAFYSYNSLSSAFPIYSHFLLIFVSTDRLIAGFLSTIQIFLTSRCLTLYLYLPNIECISKHYKPVLSFSLFSYKLILITSICNTNISFVLYLPFHHSLFVSHNLLLNIFPHIHCSLLIFILFYLSQLLYLSCCTTFSHFLPLLRAHKSQENILKYLSVNIHNLSAINSLNPLPSSDLVTR